MTSSGTGCVLSDKNIIEEIDKGNIIIDPFDLRNLSNSSYDVTLGSWYFRNTTKMDYFNPWSEKDVNEYWGQPQQAVIAKDNEYGLKDEQQYILIYPGETILSHTEQFIGTTEKSQITTMMKSRSSIMRSGLSFCKCAGWGDIGFFNRYCVEITNHGTSKILLLVGKRVSQIVFMYTGLTDNPYNKNGKYQNTNDLEQLKREWSPISLLPKLYLDWENANDILVI